MEKRDGSRGGRRGAHEGAVGRLQFQDLSGRRAGIVGCSAQVLQRAELQELVIDGIVAALEDSQRQRAGDVFRQRAFPQRRPASRQTRQVDEVESIATAEAGQVALDPVDGKLLLEGHQAFEGEDGVVEVALAGPVAGAAVVAAVKIPVIGGFGGGPWLDGRVRLVHTAIGYGAKWLESKTDTYANTAKTALSAFTALIADARAGRQIKG